MSNRFSRARNIPRKEAEMARHLDTVLPPAKILASAANGVIDAIQSNNGDIDGIFGRAGIHKDDLDNPFNELNLRQFCQLFEEAAAQTGNDNFGLQFGASYQPKQLGAIGYAAISTPTLAAAIHTLEKYFPAHQGHSSFRVVEDKGVLWLSYRVFDQRVKHLRQDAELSMAVFVNIFRHALGKAWCPLEVCFEHGRPDGAKEHSRCFGAPTEFSRRTNAIAFRRSDLAAPMPSCDPHLFALIEPFLKSRCEWSARSMDFSSIVREQIKLNLVDNDASPKKISEVLGLSKHAFKERLKTNHVTFQDLLRAARQELALHYLKDPDIPLTEVAMCLGYSELSAFSRAFRSWTGFSPRKYRRMSKR